MCANGGTATGTGSKCACTCVNSFTGPTCEIGDCTALTDGSKCENKGVVVGNSPNCKCKCAAGFKGTNCKIQTGCTQGAGGKPC